MKPLVLSEDFSISQLRNKHILKDRKDFCKLMIMTSLWAIFNSRGPSFWKCVLKWSQTWRDQHGEIMQFPTGLPLQGILQQVLFCGNWPVSSHSHPKIVQNGIIRYYANMSHFLMLGMNRTKWNCSLWWSTVFQI